MAPLLLFVCFAVHVTVSELLTLSFLPRTELLWLLQRLHKLLLCVPVLVGKRSLCAFAKLSVHGHRCQSRHLNAAYHLFAVFAGEAVHGILLCTSHILTDDITNCDKPNGIQS